MASTRAPTSPIRRSLRPASRPAGRRPSRSPRTSPACTSWSRSSPSSRRTSPAMPSTSPTSSEMQRMKPLGQFEVWFVTGSQDMYGADALRQVAANARQVADELDGSPDVPVRIVHRPVVTSSESIVETCREANASDACVGIILWMHTFSPARMWIAGLQALQKPILHLHTQFNRDLPCGEIDMDYMNLHQAAHGDREFGFIETRLGVARKTVAGHWQDPYVTARIAAWTRAACAWREAHHLKVARFGDTMRHLSLIHISE